MGLGGDIKQNQKRLREYIKKLKDNNELGDNPNYDIFLSYFRLIHNFLHLEEKYQDLVKLNGKEINKYLNLPKLNNIKDIHDKFYELYNEYSNVRFGIETMDSINEIREYLKNHPEIYNKILFRLN